MGLLSVLGCQALRWGLGINMSVVSLSVPQGLKEQGIGVLMEEAAGWPLMEPCVCMLGIEPGASALSYIPQSLPFTFQDRKSLSC